MTIDSVGYEGTISDGEVWANLQYALGNRYFVTDGSSLTATSVLSGTRQVSIGPGRFGGWGIYNYNNAAATVTLPVVSSGTKWFLIVARRTWALLDGSETETQFVVLDPGWTSAPTTLPTVGTGLNQYNQRPGIRDDQPLWIVPLSFGQTVPGTPLDVRLIGSGNNFVANHDWVLQYANWPGVEIRRGTKLYKRNLTTWDITDPAPRLLSGSAVIVTGTGWTASGLTNNARILSPYLAQISIKVRMTSGSLTAGTNGDVTNTLIGTLPTALHPAGFQPNVPCINFHGSAASPRQSAVPGSVYFNAPDGSGSFPNGGIVLQSSAPGVQLWPALAPFSEAVYTLWLTWVYPLATPYPL